MTRYFLVLIFILGCVSCSVGNTEQSEITAAFPAPPAAFDDAAVINQFRGNVALQNTARSTQNIYSNTYPVNLGSQLVIVRASYRENADPGTPLSGNLPPGDLQRYFDLRATSDLDGAGLISEGEIAYNVLNPLDGDIRPGMLRFGLKNRWRDFSYGADYKSVAKGFTSIAGTIADHSRDEALIWGEHGLGPFNLRGSIGESWERVIDESDLRVSRTAATTLHIKRARWGGSFSTSYGLVGETAGRNEENTVLVKELMASFRPSDFLLLEPTFIVKEEWNQSTGVRTQTPTSGLSFTYSPLRAFRLTGRTFLSRIFNGDGSHDVRVHGTSAAVDWRLGKFLGHDDVLSFTFKYDRHVNHVLRSNSHAGLSGILQFKIAGF